MTSLKVYFCEILFLSIIANKIKNEIKFDISLKKVYIYIFRRFIGLYPVSIINSSVTGLWVIEFLLAQIRTL